MCSLPREFRLVLFAICFLAASHAFAIEHFYWTGSGLPPNTTISIPVTITDNNGNQHYLDAGFTTDSTGYGYTGGPFREYQVPCEFYETASGGMSADGQYVATGGKAQAAHLSSQYTCDIDSVGLTVSAAPALLPPDSGQTKACDENTGCPFQGPMATYSIHLLLASLHIEDTPISYKPPRGPAIDFRVAYNHREANQPTFYFGNIGAKWTHNWLSYVTDNPANSNANASVYVRGGGTENYSGFNSGTQSYAADLQSMAVLVRTSGASYEKRFPDGSKEIFSVSDGATLYPRRIFLSSVVDPSGNAVTLSYDGSLRLTTITDPLGQTTAFSYDLQSDSLKITKVTDPFNRFATFDYTSGQLTKITDPVGIQSQFVYDAGGDFINTLTTPYGSTTFAKGGTDDSFRWLEATDPLGGKERVEYDHYRTGITCNEGQAPSGVYNSNLQFRNTFYWNKKAMADAPGDYSKAQVIHWLATSDGRVSGIKHSKKQPLENRVWYLYAGQTNDTIGSSALPTQMARVLDDATTQSSQFSYNAVGNITKEVDPLGRTTTYAYDTNGIDLLGVYRQRTGGASTDPFGMAADKFWGYANYTLHKPQSVTDAAGETTNYVYNSYGQRQTVTNAKSETTTYAYDRDQNSDGVSDGYLLSVTGPVTGSTTTYHYDSAKRIDTVTDADAYVLGFGYDNIDRVTSINYPDTTAAQFKYTRYANGVDTGVMTLDLGAIRDRRNPAHWTYREYDANRQLTKITDPLGRNTFFNWCSCGALTSITDARGAYNGDPAHTTTFARDIQSRVTTKTFADNKSTSYVYENTTSRLKSMTDAKNQRTNYSYFRDNDLQQISYTDTNGQPLNPATPSVSFTYDPNYNRVATIVDGTGTTTYTYNPITGAVSLGATQLASIDGPLANDTLTYTYDELGRQLTNLVNGVGPSSRTYDSLGRLSAFSNPLGAFTNNFVSTVSSRIQSTTVPSGPTINYTYFGNTGDKRLQRIQNNFGATLLSQFDYVYDADGEITILTRQMGASGYPIQWYNTPYGASMNDAADQLTNVCEQTAPDVVACGSHTYDNAGNRTEAGAFSYNNVNQISNSGYNYDNNGNLTADLSRTYTWDAANRLVTINYVAFPEMRTDFTYDGLGRRVKIVETGFPVPILDFSFQPTNTNYRDYSAPGSFSVTAGTYKFKLEGLNPNGGDNYALIDAIKVLKGTNNMLTNNGFENPVLPNGTYQINPAGATWTFVGNAGISRNGSVIASANPATPAGTQLGFIEMTANISETLTLTAGTYTFTMKAAQRVANPTFQTLRATLQSQNIGVTSTKQFIWDGNTIVEERDANNNVTRRFYPQGEQISGTKYFYTRDHLGSIRELVDSTGTVQARYDYDPFGVRTKLSGSLDASFGFTGHYYHLQSALHLAPYRAYDATVGRWLNRDPFGERGGVNLYEYSLNDPLARVDPTGKWPTVITGGFEALLPYAPLWNPQFYQDADQIRTESMQTFPRLPGDPYDVPRHHCAARRLASKWGTPAARIAGIGNELEGFFMWDLGLWPSRTTGRIPGPWNTLPARIWRGAPWAFQWGDLIHNEEGFRDAEKDPDAAPCEVTIETL